MKLKEVYRSDNSVDADLLKVMLEQNEIRCEVQDETQGGLAGVNLSPVKIVVAEEDYKAARAIVEEYERS